MRLLVVVVPLLCIAGTVFVLWYAVQRGRRRPRRWVADYRPVLGDTGKVEPFIRRGHTVIVCGNPISTTEPDWDDKLHEAMADARAKAAAANSERVLTR